MSLFWTIVLWLLAAWLVYGLYDMWRNKEKTSALLSMAFNTGRKEGVDIRKSIDDKLSKKK